MAPDNIMDKVAKLLALAEKAGTPEEAELATSRAEELMLKHGIEMEMIAARAPGKRAEAKIVIHKIHVSNTYEAATVTYGYAVAPSFDCKSYQSKHPSGKGLYIWLVGHESDVEQAATLVNSLIIQAEQAMNHWWKTVGRARLQYDGRAEQKLARRQFMFSFGSGVRQRLAETRKRVVHEAGTGAELVLVDKNKRVDDWIGKNMNFSKAKGRGIKGGTYEAGLAGHQAGRDAVGQKGIHA